METLEPATYDFHAIESKWQQHWLTNKTFRCEIDQTKPKFYVLDMFPYPSGAGLHVGHPEGYTATDIFSRYKRMKGFNVLHPMGWDAFGLPAEQYAVKTGTHPRVTTAANIKTFRRQIQALGLSYDWDREIDTTDPRYYKWTQWIFLQLYNKGLAYESFAPVNWCPELSAVLANEEVIDGRSEIGNHPVIKKPMRQWMLKITEYAERLLQALELLDWPESIKMMQRHWIGRSEGAEVAFDVEGSSEKIEVFTTRPDTLFGATFLVLAPEHPAVANITSAAQSSAVQKYLEQTAGRSERDRLADTTKTGEFTGGFALNPVNGNKLPVYIADYVLVTYGKGAIMAVPGHDSRDHEFALKYKLPIVRVLTGGLDDIQVEAHTGDGQLINSDFLNGLSKDAAISKMISWLEDKHHGRGKVQYKLRDWLFSRQRYWGEPIPVAHDCNGKPIQLCEDDLPIMLPEMDDFKPSEDGESALAKAGDWLSIQRDGKELKRETNTMPQWAGSCWYYLRFLDPLNDEEAWSKESERYWMPVDLYVGGAEHAVLHLLYARFWHKVLFDLGHVSTPEPFIKLVNQGMILGENGEKMSKSRGNVINPDDVIKEWGSDSMRLYEMFMGPLVAAKPWQTKGIAGVHRFQNRVFRLLVNADGSTNASRDHDDPTLIKELHKTIKKVGEDTSALHFNTAISAMMEWVNLAYKHQPISQSAAEKFLLLLSPYAPHLCEELWQRLGHGTSLAYEAWPEFDITLIGEERITLSIQINGKLRGTLELDKDTPKEKALQAAKEVPNVSKQLEGKILRKEIFVPNKIVNFVVG